MNAKLHQFKINLPEDVKEWLENEAERNLRSQSNEIILALREKMDRQAKEASEKK